MKNIVHYLVRKKRTSTLTLLRLRDQQSSKLLEKNVENLVSSRLQRLEQKEQNQLYSRLVAAIEAKIAQMEST